jgi:hypothetical protein
MKKIFLILFTINLLFSCSPEEDNNPKFRLELLAVHSSVFPAEFKKDITYDIPIRFVRTSTCHSFSRFYYEKNLNFRTIAIEAAVLIQDNCVAGPQATSEQILKFTPTTETSYIFKLWKGKDNLGADIFEEITVPVVP